MRTAHPSNELAVVDPKRCSQWHWKRKESHIFRHSNTNTALVK